MNVVCLPEKVRKAVAEAAGEEQPVCVVRASGSLGGSPGEAYVVGLADRLLLFSRGIGEFEYTQVCLGHADITAVAIRKERHNSFLEISGPEQAYSVKFASYEERDVKPLVERWGDATGPPADDSEEPTVAVQVADAATPSVPISPWAALAASLMFMTTIDEDVGDVEEAYIKDLCSGVEGAFEEALGFYNDHTPEELFAAVSYLDRQQRLCILANMVELAMSDGVLHTSEQQLSSLFARTLGVADRELRAITDVLLLKNQTSVLLG